MLIKIISGSYGHRPMLPNGKKSPYVKRITPNDPPIDVDEAEAKALVEAGVAEIVGEKAEAAEPVKAEEKPKGKKTAKAKDAEEVID